MRRMKAAIRSIAILTTFSNNNNLLLKAFQTQAYFQSQSNTIVCPMSHNRMENRSNELQTQWAEGIDVWPKVPIVLNHHNVSTVDNSTATTNSNTINYIKIQTKVVPTTTNTSSSSKSPWPDIVTSRILYGFGAYNPRGTVVPNEINTEQHQKLRKDIINSLNHIPDAVWWEGASIWQDGSSERGFILAFSKEDAEQGFTLSVQLATKYNQGAIYKFEYQQERLIRNTIAVLDEGTDASVIVEMDDSTLDVNPFE